MVEQDSYTKIKDKLWYLFVGVMLILIIVLYISFRFNDSRANNIISRYDGYLETVDSLAKGCSPLPTNLKGFSEEILGVDNYSVSNVDFEACKKFIDIDPAYFMDLKDTIRQMAFDKYYEETKSSIFYAITDTIQCLVKVCPVNKISTHYHL